MGAYCFWGSREKVLHYCEWGKMDVVFSGGGAVGYLMEGVLVALRSPIRRLGEWVNYNGLVRDCR